MLTYSVVVASNDSWDFSEFVVETYSNEEAAKQHEQFIIDSDLRIDGLKWGYVFIRKTRVADVFEEVL